MQILFQSNVSVGVQFYPWFKFYFVLFQTHYHIIIIHFHTQKQKKTKFQPRIKLKHNISIIRRWKLVKHLFVSLETIDEKWMSSGKRNIIRYNLPHSSSSEMPTSYKGLFA